MEKIELTKEQIAEIKSKLFEEVTKFTGEFPEGCVGYFQGKEVYLKGESK